VQLRCCRQLGNLRAPGIERKRDGRQVNAPRIPHAPSLLGALAPAAPVHRSTFPVGAQRAVDQRRTAPAANSSSQPHQSDEHPRPARTPADPGRRQLGRRSRDARMGDGRGGPESCPTDRSRRRGARISVHEHGCDVRRDRTDHRCRSASRLDECEHGKGLERRVSAGVHPPRASSRRPLLSALCGQSISAPAGFVGSHEELGAVTDRLRRLQLPAARAAGSVMRQRQRNRFAQAWRDRH